VETTTARTAGAARTQVRPAPERSESVRPRPASSRASASVALDIGPWSLLAVVSALGLVLLTIAPFADPDLYWHVDAGREILQQRSVAGVGQSWTFTSSAGEWVTTQWLSQVLLALLHDAGGWSAIAALRLGVSVVVALQLAHLLLRGPRTIAAVVVYTVTLVVLLGNFQERPQLASLLLLPWLAGVLVRVVRGDDVRLLTTAAITWLWANLHGLWVLVPSCLVLVLLGTVLQDGWQHRRSRRLAALVLGCSAAAAMTPVGPSLLLAPVRFSGATWFLDEWQPTQFDHHVPWAFAALLASVLLGWAHSTRPVRYPELLLVAGLIGFALLAARNVLPAALLLSPFAARRLAQVMPRRDLPGGRREARILATTALALVVAAVPVLVAQHRKTHPLPDELPLAIAERLAAEPGVHRAFTDYDRGGVFVHWGGDGLRLFVDGRADRYSRQVVEDYLDIMAVRGDWRRTFARLNVDSVVVRSDSALADRLAEREGWHADLEDGDYVLLRPSPDA
jgi:hypothetical protein